MKILLSLAAALAITATAPAQVVVDATGSDTFSTADMHGISNNGGPSVDSVTIDLSATAGAFWDMDGASSFGNSTEPVIGATNYGGTVTWSPTGGQDPSLTATFSPALAAGEFIRFGADTDFFVSDPCPGGNFATGGAVVTATSGMASTTCTYAFINTDTAEATCTLGPPPFTLTDPIPGIAGTTNTVRWQGACPNSTVAVVFGFTLGTTPVGGVCPNLNVGIASPSLAGIFTSSSLGDGSASGFVPPGLSGSTILIQAVDTTCCQVSNLVIFTFP